LGANGIEVAHTPGASGHVDLSDAMSMKQRPGFPARIDIGAKPHTAGATITTKASTSAVVKRSHQKVTAAAHAPAHGHALDSRAVRANMVAKLAKGGIRDRAVLAALDAVERHRFVDSALVNQAYEDTSLPIGLGQTISKPGVVSRMLELLMNGASHKLGRVLEIGTGCGYQAALLSHLASEVYSIERLRGLHEKARQNLRPFRLANLHLLMGDGMIGYAKGAPYAAIIAAAGGEALPEAWLDQLAVGGRLVAPVQLPGGSAARQALVVVDRGPNGFTRTILEPVLFVPLKSGVE
jgi:protein-L-isoaspartate(D-aspartate) O-methyltransferase